MNRKIFKEDKEYIINYLNTTTDKISSLDFFEILNNGINVPDSVITNNQELKNSSRVACYYLKNNPEKHILFNDVVFNKNTISFIDELYQNNLMKFSTSLKNRIFKIYPLFIKYFNANEITNQHINYLSKNNITITEEMLINFNELTKSAPVMNLVVNNNSSLIKYTKTTLLKSVLEKAASEYKITKEDIKNNYFLSEYEDLLSLDSDLLIYSKMINSDDKYNIIYNLLNDNKIDEIQKLPFFNSDYNSLIDGLDLITFINFYKNTSLNDKLYSNILQKLHLIAESYASKEYEVEKPLFEYNNILSVFGKIKFEINESTKENNYKRFAIFKESIFKFIENKNEYNITSYLKINEELDNIYNMMNTDARINLTNCKDLCNLILNTHRNNYIKIKIDEYLNKIKEKYSLNNKKIKLLINSEKISLCKEYIIHNKLDKLQINNQILLTDLYNVFSILENNKDLKKTNITFSQTLFDLFMNEFTSKGELSISFLKNHLKDIEEENLEFISKKYNQLLYKYSDKIIIDDKEKEKILFDSREILPLTITNFNIFDKEKLDDLMSRLLSVITHEDLDRIKYSGTKKLFLTLFYFIDIIDNLSINTFINILKYSDNISSSLEIYSEEDVIMNIPKIISLSEKYSTDLNIKKEILGTNFNKYINDYDIDDYFDYYIKMLNSNVKTIPSIYLETENYIYENVSYSNTDKLLIGAIFKNSCIDLKNYAGYEMYNEVLCEENGDVLMIYDKNNNLINRILLVRRGNVLLLIPRDEDAHSLILMKYLATKLLKESVNSNDNLEFILTPGKSIIKDTSFDIVHDAGFLENFPHADLSTNCILLSSKYNSNIKDINNYLDFEISPKVKYHKSNNLNINYDSSIKDIERISYIYHYINNTLNNITYRDESEYKNIISGDDFYFAVLNNDEIESIILPYDYDNTINIVNEITRTVDKNNQIR